MIVKDAMPQNLLLSFRAAFFAVWNLSRAIEIPRFARNDRPEAE